MPFSVSVLSIRRVPHESLPNYWRILVLIRTSEGRTFWRQWTPHYPQGSGIGLAKLRPQVKDCYRWFAQNSRSDLFESVDSAGFHRDIPQSVRNIIGTPAHGVREINRKAKWNARHMRSYR